MMTTVICLAALMPAEEQIFSQAYQYQRTTAETRQPQSTGWFGTTTDRADTSDASASGVHFAAFMRAINDAYTRGQQAEAQARRLAQAATVPQTTKQRRGRRQRQLSALREQVRQLQTELEQRHENCDRYEQRIAELTATLEAQQAQMNTLLNRLATTQNQQPRYLPSYMRNSGGSAIQRTMHTTPAQQSAPSRRETQPKHRFEFSIRYEGEGIIGPNIADIFKGQNRSSSSCAVCSPSHSPVPAATLVNPATSYRQLPPPTQGSTPHGYGSKSLKPNRY